MPQSAPGAHVVVFLIDVIVVEILEAHRPLGQYNFQSIDGSDSSGGAIGSIGDSVAIDKGTYTLLCITDMNGRILAYTSGLVTDASNWQLYY